ncbi:VOC family protein [Silvibacterium acidisoli]|uniref:VOC family protein n=1 Tax=Acidobacteriaceae bacterium ZG23-2 TaxID=2883246 RepID=UPI00406C2E51
MVTGLNHITLAVKDLDLSFRFYTELLYLRPVARWYKGAYLMAGSLWVCLTLDSETRPAPLPEYTHTAFTVPLDQFEETVRRLNDASVPTWQQNHSPGKSFYFLDPNGHKLEIHASDLASRLESLKEKPPRDLVLFS